MRFALRSCAYEARRSTATLSEQGLHGFRLAWDGSCSLWRGRFHRRRDFVSQAKSLHFELASELVSTVLG